MFTLAKIIGMVIVAIGTAIAINPHTFKFVMNFWKKGKNIYIAGGLRIVFGVIFLMIGGQCKVPAVIYTLSALMLIGGGLIFALKEEMIHNIFVWWEMRPQYLIRAMGLFALAIGAAILFSI